MVVSELGVPAGFQHQPGSGAGQGSFPNPLPGTCPVTWAVSFPSTAVQP